MEKSRDNSKSVYDALQKEYLKTLLFCICEDVEGSMIQEYSFSFSYVDSCEEEVFLNISRNGNKKNGATFRTNSMDITPDHMRSSACKMIRTLVQLMRTLDLMPTESTILMKLLYYDDITVKSILDPCEDDNDDHHEDEVNLGADSDRNHDSSSDSKVKGVDFSVLNASED